MTPPTTEENTSAENQRVFVDGPPPTPRDIDDAAMWTTDRADPMALIRARRGWDNEFARRLHARATMSLDRMAAAVDLLHRHSGPGSMITVLTDFDMDGITSGLLTYGGLAELGFNVEIVVPDYTGARHITAADVDNALALHPDTTLFITCDVGATSNEGIAAAQTAGVAVLVTDHHEEDPADPCIADVMLNPNAIDSTYPDRHICGAQVAHKLLATYAHFHRRDKVPAISLLSMFAGIGCLADVMPLTGQNRDLVTRALSLLRLSVPEIAPGKWGRWDDRTSARAKPESSILMKIINSGDHDGRFARLFWGMSMLLRTFAQRKKLTAIDNIDASFIGYTMAPTFNATRRVGGDMADAFNIFAPQVVQASRPDLGRDMVESAHQLIDNNEYRKVLLEEAMAKLEADDQPNAPVVWYSDAPAGILGLIATRVSRDTGLPALVVNPQTLSGSGRAPGWFGILDAADGIEGLTAQGHQQACGVNAESSDALNLFADAVNEEVERLISVQDPALEPPRADLHLLDATHLGGLSAESLAVCAESVDMAMPDNEIMLDLFAEIESLGPFGHGFSYPEIRITVPIAQAELSSMKNKHLKITTPSGMDLLWWNAIDRRDEIDAAELATFTVTLGINDFRGRITPQAIISSATFINADANDDQTEQPR